MPHLQLQASKSLEVCRKEFAALPAVIDMEPATYMLNVLNHLCDEFQSHVRGGTEFSGLIHQNRDAYVALKTAIQKTTPRFVPHPDKTQRRAKNAVGDEEDLERIINQTKEFNLDDMHRHIEKCVLSCGSAFLKS